ncbi:MAG: hypothetical protein WA721_18065 [Candidatus Binataceae bacterium]|jgi:hypothetical protein
MAEFNLISESSGFHRITFVDLKDIATWVFELSRGGIFGYLKHKGG